MKKLFFLFLVGTMLLLTGCSSHSATRYFEKSSLYSHALPYTKKSDIIFKNELKIMMNVTYLNPVDEKWDNEFENFIVGVYIVDTASQDNPIDLEDLSFFLSLNERNYVNIEKLTVKHPMFGHLPLMNQWANYYVVKFDKSSKDIATLKVHTVSNETIVSGKTVQFNNNPSLLNLTLEHTTYGQTSVLFESKQ